MQQYNIHVEHTTKINITFLIILYILKKVFINVCPTYICQIILKLHLLHSQRGHNRGNHKKFITKSQLDKQFGSQKKYY